MLIDSHTHFYPQEISKNPDAWAESRGESYWKKLVGKRPDGKLSLQGFPSEKKFLADMDSAGIERVIIQGWYWENSETCDEVNAMIANFVKRYPDRLSAFAAVQPRFAKHACDTVKRVIDNGFIGIGEIHDGVQNFSYINDDFASLAEICAEHNLPICVHLTERSERDYLGKVKTDFNSAMDASRKFPKTNFIFAHWLGGEIFENKENAKKIIEQGNVFFDSAASPLLYGIDTWWKGTREFENVAIYGSDYPLRLYPRKFKTEEMQTIVAEARLNVPEKFAEKFFQQNVKKLTNIL